MNLILFERSELSAPLSRHDRRALHLVQVLRRREGDTFDAGIIDGPRGKGTIVRIAEAGLSLEFAWSIEPPLNDDLTMIVGVPRPQTARDILRESTALGVRALHFVSTDKGDASYAQSTLWRSKEWHKQLILGAEQAFCTRLPEVTSNRSLWEVLDNSLSAETSRIALDNYEGTKSLAHMSTLQPAVALAVGSERGWSSTERDGLRSRGFTLVHLGSRVLRTETACIAAIALVKAMKGWL